VIDARFDSEPPPEHHRATETARLALVQLSSDLPLAAVFSRACELAAAAISVERVGVWLYVDDRTALRCVNLYERSRNEHSPGAVLWVADFPSYFKALSIRKAVPAEFATADPRTSELANAYLKPLGISSVLDAGIFVGNDLVGVVCFEHVGLPREWTTEARDFAGSVADLLAVRYQSSENTELRTALRAQAGRQVMIDKVASLEQLAAGMARDYQRIFAQLVSTGEELAAQNNLPQNVRERLATLTTAAASGVESTSEVLAFTRSIQSSPIVMDPGATMNGFLPMLRATIGPDHPVRYDPPNAVGRVLFDPATFKQVVVNLANNSRDALAKGGDICVRVAPVRMTSRAGLSEHYVMLEVSDRGVGMDEETQRRACDSFFSTKPAGTGIGLAVVRRAADRAGGFVRIKSQMNQGTSVRVFFPRVEGSSGGTTEYSALPDLEPNR
jgi:two-component system, cell cycle sensor histidine kinase and response regulator CckA